VLYPGMHGSDVVGITAFAGKILRKPRDVEVYIRLDWLRKSVISPWPPVGKPARQKRLD